MACCRAWTSRQRLQNFAEDHLPVAEPEIEFVRDDPPETRQGDPGFGDLRSHLLGGCFEDVLLSAGRSGFARPAWYLKYMHTYSAQVCHVSVLESPSDTDTTH